MTDWAELERIGRQSGHVLCECPSCGGRVMVSILNSSGTRRWLKSGGGWPPCKQCRAGSPLRKTKTPGLRVEPIGDVALVRLVRPGHGPTATQRRLDAKAAEARAEAGEPG